MLWPAFHFHSVLLIFVNLWPISTLCVADMVVADIVVSHWTDYATGLCPSVIIIIIIIDIVEYFVVRLYTMSKGAFQKSYLSTARGIKSSPLQSLAGNLLTVLSSLCSILHEC